MCSRFAVVIIISSSIVDVIDVVADNNRVFKTDNSRVFWATTTQTPCLVWSANATRTPIPQATQADSGTVCQWQMNIFECDSTRINSTSQLCCYPATHPDPMVRFVRSDMQPKNQGKKSCGREATSASQARRPAPTNNGAINVHCSFIFDVPAL